MSGNFEWHTEDKWDEFAEADNSAEPPPKKRWRWVVVGVMLFITIGLGGYFFTQNLNERVEEVTALTEENVRASFVVIERAANSNDIELFNSLLSGRDDEWTQAQQRLFIEGLIFGRTPFGLQKLNETATITDVEMAPELRSAELTVEQPYAIDIGNNLTDTVVLEQTFTFRRGSNNFIYAPAEVDFWGEQSTRSSDRLRLNFREADAEIVTQLFNDLDTLLVEFCPAFYDETCGQRLPLNLTLSVDPDTLITTSSTTAFLNPANDRNRLPSPTLIGRPTDKTGYDALLTFYMEQIVTNVMADIVGYECCDQIAFFQALIEHQMNALGLKPEPVAANDYQILINNGLTLVSNELAWEIASERDLTIEMETLAGATVAYLNDQNPDLRTIDLLKDLQSVDTYFIWYGRLLSAESQADRVTPFIETESAAWQRFVIDKASSHNEPPPQPYPDKTILTACSAETGSTVWQFDTAVREWSQFFDSKFPMSYLLNLPGDDAFALYQLDFETDAWSMTIVQSDRGTVVSASDNSDMKEFWYPRGTGGNRLVLSLSDSIAPIIDEEARYLLDWRTCADTNKCKLTPIFGDAIWSPSAEHGIVIATDPAQLGIFQTNLIDVDGNIVEVIVTNTVSLPFWMDDETFAYVQSIDRVGTPGSQAFVRKIGSNTAEPLFNIDDLADALPGELEGRVLFFDKIAPYPGSTTDLLIIVHSPARQSNLLIKYNLETGAAELLHNTQATLSMQNGANGQPISEATSADNRYVIIHEESARGLSLSNLLLLDTETDELTPIGSGSQPQWIDNWLIDQHSGYLRLMLPGQTFQQFIPLPAENCSTMAWYND